MLDKTTRLNLLYDFYQELLTDKQRQYMELYFQDDYSLGEIAEEFGISRQGVYEHIKRAEVLLEEYEDKLNLLSKYQQRHQIIDELEKLILTIEKNENQVDRYRLMKQKILLLKQVD